MKLSPSRSATATGRCTRTASSRTSMKLQRPTASWQITITASKTTSPAPSRVRPPCPRPALGAEPFRLHPHRAHVEPLRVAHLEPVQLAVVQVAHFLARDADQVVVRLSGSGPRQRGLVAALLVERIDVG